MRTRETIKGLACGVTFVGVLVLALSGSALGATPNQFVLASHFGLQVDKTTGGNICTIGSEDQCQPGAPSETGVAGGFFFPGSVAVNKHGDVYVADTVNQRVQELGPEGAFISMFGWNVNKTKVETTGTTQQERDVCTAVSGDVCQAGEQGGNLGLPDQLGNVEGVAVDQSTDDVYVLTPSYHRVEEFTEAGAFVLMVGGEVNETKDISGGTEAERNLCTAVSGDACKAGVEAPEGSKAQGAFKVAEGFGNLLAVGGPEDLLYVGDEGRVQEIRASGEWASEVPLTELSSTGRASAVAVDSTGDVFVGDLASPGVHEFNTANQLQSQVIGPAASNTTVEGLALDTSGRLGILSGEFVDNEFKSFGFLYSTGGAKIGEFAPPSGQLPGSPHSLAFAPATAALPDELYVLETTTHEVEAYEPVVLADVHTCPVEQLTATSATLCGQINPNGVATKGFFEFGNSPALGLRTATVFEGSGTTQLGMSSSLSELEPNEKYHYKAAGEAVVNGKKLVVTGEEAEFTTPSVPQQLVGQPSASFVETQTAVLSASLNPEHTSTSYHFEYGPCPTLSGCAIRLSTADKQSSQYGVVGTTQEVSGLAQMTIYSFRLVTEREGESPVIGPEGTFTTDSAPVLQASTGPASAVAATTAIISGTVDPSGEPASYAFELGVYQGAATQFGTVFSGSTGSAPVTEALGLSGLQPGRTYAYRITITSGFGTATGAPVTFTTLGLPSVIAEPIPLTMLAVPKIAFPRPAKAKVTKCRRGFTHNKRGKCVKVKHSHRAKKKRRRKK
jgi:hypothetical protein